MWALNLKTTSLDSVQVFTELSDINIPFHCLVVELIKFTWTLRLSKLMCSLCFYSSHPIVLHLHSSHIHALLIRGKSLAWTPYLSHPLNQICQHSDKNPQPWIRQNCFWTGLELAPESTPILKHSTCLKTCISSCIQGCRISGLKDTSDQKMTGTQRIQKTLKMGQK